MRDGNVWYWAQHVAGKIRCWEDCFINQPIFPCCEDEANQVERIKKIYLNKGTKNYEIINDMYETWDWNLMEKKCDKILKDFNGNLDAMTNMLNEE